MQRCLIVDGTEIVRRVTRIILADFGFESVEAPTGAAAMALLEKQVFELALVDAHLTDVSPLDILRQIRGKAAGRTYVLYCTTEYDLVDLQRAHAAGATDVLVKPFDRVSLAQKLDARTLEDAISGPPRFFSRLARSELKRIA
jgi:two-component system chemotaxis response regulator CheY